MTLRTIRRRWRALFDRQALERELDDEMHLHLQLETDDLMRTRGLSRAEAEREARLRFGGVDRYTESHRDVRGTRWLEDGVADLRYALRTLRRTPAFTLSAILVLALGIGTSTAIFSAVNTVVLSGLPYEDADRLVRIYDVNSEAARWPLSVVEWKAIAEQQTTMSAVGAMAIDESPVAAGNADVARTRVVRVSSGIFPLLGIRAAIGRVILPSDEPLEAPPVTVVADAYARRVFGNPAAALGKTIEINGLPRTIVGVLAPGIKDLGGFTGEIWPAYQPRTPTRRGPFFLVVLGKVKPGVSAAANAADLRAISKRIYPLWSQGFSDTTAHFTPVPLQAAVIGDAPKTLWMFAGAALLLLLVAITNVANLMLARMSSRWQEVSLRQMLGASRGRLVRLVVTESVLLASIGAALGAVAAWLLLKMLLVIAGTMPRLALATIDGRALAFAVAVGVITGLVIGIHPVLTLARGAGSTSVRAASRDIGSGRGASRLRGALVAVEFALALPLLAGASQLMASSARLMQVDPGFDPAPIAYARIGLPTGRYDSTAKVMDYWRRAMARVSEVPGVVAVGYSTELPPWDVGLTNDFVLEGSGLPEGATKPNVPWMIVSASYFDALGVRLLEGRMFTPADTGPTNILIVSESFARRYSPDRPAVGRRIYGGGCNPQTCPPQYIVGVVSDVKYDGMAKGAEAAYEPATQGMWASGYLMIRTRGEPRAVVGGVRSVLRQVDPVAAIDEIGSMEDQVYQSTAQPRHWAMLFTGFAGAALALAAVGIFGLLSYLVTTMRREIGVRVALGAQRGQIAGMIVKRGIINCAIGAAVGIALALAGRQLIQASLYESRAADPLTLTLAAGALLVVALIAAWIPAHRAARIDPMNAIRSD